MSQACVRCTRPVGDAFVCVTCATDAAKALGQVSWLERELDLAITRQTCFAARGEMTKGSKVTPVPFNVPAGEARDVLRNILVGWCRLYAEECGADLPGDTLTAMSRFLMPRVEWFRHFEAASEFVDEVTATIRSCIRLVDSPPNRTTFKVADCIEEDAGVRCPGEVKAYIPTSDDERPRLECSYCGSVWHSEMWLRFGKRFLAAEAS